MFKASYSAVHIISATKLVGCRTSSKLVVQIKLIVYFFYCQYKFKPKINFTTKLNLYLAFWVKKNCYVARERLRDHLLVSTSLFHVTLNILKYFFLLKITSVVKVVEYDSSVGSCYFNTIKLHFTSNVQRLLVLYCW